jgi:chromosome segregation ATPase
VNALKRAEDGLEAAKDETRMIEKLLEGARVETEQIVATKDERIAHLEVSKLTQEQMEKIKVLKEEHKKSREDVKTMKKQLSQLKKAYDDLKATGTSSSSTTDAADGSAHLIALSDITELKEQLQEVTNKQETSQNMTKSLKEKLKDCSKQLQEYEGERNAVIKVLEDSGVDTTGIYIYIYIYICIYNIYTFI